MSVYKTESELELELQYKRAEIELLNSEIESLKEQAIILKNHESQLDTIKEILTKPSVNFTLFLPDLVVDKPDVVNKLSALLNKYFKTFLPKLPDKGEVFVVGNYSFILDKKVFEDAQNSLNLKLFFRFS